MGADTERPERELTVGEMILSVFSIYKTHFTEFAILFVLTGLAGGFLSYITFTVFSFDQVIRYPEADVARWVMGNFGSLVVSLFFLGLVSWVIYAIAGGIAVRFASDLIKNGQADIRSAFGEAVARLPALLAASLITALLIGLGFILFIVPGIILVIIFSLVVPTIMIERPGALESLGRSRRLVDGRWGNTFIFLLTIALIVAIASLTTGFFLITVTPFPLNNILTTILSSILQPLYFIAVTVLYHSMIAREQSAT